MGKRASETALQKAGRLQRQVLQLQNKGYTQAIASALKKYPELVPRIYEQLKSCLASKGVDLDALRPDEDAHGGFGTGAFAPVAPAAAPVPEGPAAGRFPHQQSPAPLALANESHTDSVPPSGAVAPDLSDSGSAAEASPQPPPAGRLKTFGSLSALQVAEVLGLIEPVCFSKSALKALQNRGMKAPPKQTLLEIAEYCVQMTPHSQVDAGNLSGLAELLGERNSALGRRGVDLALPPSWPANGVYSLIVDKSVLKVRNKFSNLTRIVPPGCLQGVSPATVSIANNFSEDKASLTSPGSLLNFTVALLFSSSRMDALQGGAGKRQKTSSGFARSPGERSSAAGSSIASSPASGAASLGGDGDEIATPKGKQPLRQSTHFSPASLPDHLEGDQVAGNLADALNAAAGSNQGGATVENRPSPLAAPHQSSSSNGEFGLVPPPPPPPAHVGESVGDGDAPMDAEGADE